MVLVVEPVTDPQFAPDHAKKVAEGISRDSIYVVDALYVGGCDATIFLHDAIDVSGAPRQAS